MQTSLSGDRRLRGPKLIPGAGAFATMRGLSRYGFLAYVGQLWQTYGDTFQLRIGYRTLIFAIHPEALRQINVVNRQNYDKLSTHDVLRRYLFGDGLVASTGDLWRRQRKLMSPFFKPRGVQAYADIMLRDGMRLHERWEQLAAGGHPVDIGDEMMRVTASIILKAMFSTEADVTIVDMQQAVETLLAFAQAQMSGIRPPLWVPTPLNRRYSAARDRVRAYINGLIAQRRALPEDQRPDDFLTRLMQAQDEETGEHMPESLLRDECITMFAAGYETTAHAMSAAWYALASNPAVEARLHDELDTVLGDHPPTVEQLDRLPYTLRVIKEAMRLYPPAPFYIREALAADTLDGYAIPAGSGVMMSPYYTHRHPHFWEDPLKFDPDRWTSEREAAQHPYAYHPFAIGQRMCIGYSFSLLESHLMLALLARRFVPRLMPGYSPQWVMNSTLGTSNGFPMQIHVR